MLTLQSWHIEARAEGWALRKDRAQRASRCFKFKYEALAWAKKYCKGLFYVHSSSGLVHEKYEFK